MQHSTITVSGTEEDRRVPWIPERNLLYRTVDEPGGQAANLACLDLFFTKDQRPKRVVVYVHGGKWIAGDKSEIEDYPRLLDFFVSNDCVVASINFRLAKESGTRIVSYQDQARDIAAALKWLTAHVEEYGGRPEDFVLLGYSSGAHLATLVALDEQYLASAGLDGAVVRSVIAMDIHAYDIPAALTLMEGTPLKVNIPRMISLFGESREEQESASPASYVSKAGPKSFLLFSCAMSGRLSQTVSRAISDSFKEKLMASGHKAHHEHLALHDHHEILSSFGRPHDAVPENVEIFLNVEAAAHLALQDRGKRHPFLQPSTKNLRLEAVRLVETTDRPAPEIAQEFGVRVDELYAWMKEFKRHRKKSVSLSGGTIRASPQKGGQASQTVGGKFSEEFKREAVRLAETTDRPTPEIAQEFGVRVDELYAWMKEFKRHGKKSVSLSGGTIRASPQKGGQASQTVGGKFSEEFKREAVHLTETAGRPAVEIAWELGVGIDKLYAWKRELRWREKISASPRGETNQPIPLKSAEISKAPDAKFSEELKREAVRLAETTDRPAPEIAQQFGVRVDELYAWVKEFKRHRKKSAPLPGGTIRARPPKGGQASQTVGGKFSEEFKWEVVHLTEATDRPVAEIAREYGLRVDELYAWKKEFRRRDKMSTPRLERIAQPAPLSGGKEPQFSEEFKREAIRLLDSSGHPANRIARELKLPVSKLYQWRKERAGAA